MEFAHFIDKKTIVGQFQVTDAVFYQLPYFPLAYGVTCSFLLHSPSQRLLKPLAQFSPVLPVL
jgi:hypothetical protein